MPQLLNTLIPPELSNAVDQMLDESGIPEFTVGNWESALKNRGINTNSLADMYVESLGNLKPHARVAAIERLLASLGATKGQTDSIPSAPQIIINGDNIQLNQLITPQRKLT